MTFPEACQAYHDHQITASNLWEFVLIKFNLVAWQLRQGLFTQIQLWCGGV